MEHAVEAVIRDCARASEEGRAGFGAIVAALAEVGVEAYQADFRARTLTYYLPSGDVFALPLEVPEVSLPTPFAADALEAAIRGAQRGQVQYPEFKQRAMAAGCVGYVVWIAGRQVSYFGRRGELHVEPFPSS